MAPAARMLAISVRRVASCMGKAGGLNALRLSWGSGGYLGAQQTRLFGTSAVHLWVAIECFALPSPTTVQLTSQPLQLCFTTTFVAAPARISAPLAWRFTSVAWTSAHLGQAIAGAAAVAVVAEAFLSLSIWRTFGEAAMPSSPTGLYWALAALARARTAMVAKARHEERNIVGIRFVFIFVSFFRVVSFFIECLS